MLFGYLGLWGERTMKYSLWSTPWLLGAVGRENQWNTVLITVQSVKHTFITSGCGVRKQVKYSILPGATCKQKLRLLEHKRKGKNILFTELFVHNSLVAWNTGKREPIKYGIKSGRFAAWTDIQTCRILILNPPATSLHGKGLEQAGWRVLWWTLINNNTCCSAHTLQFVGCDCNPSDTFDLLSLFIMSSY